MSNFQSPVFCVDCGADGKFPARFEIDENMQLGTLVRPGFTVLQIDLDPALAPWNSTPCRTFPTLALAKSFIDDQLKSLPLWPQPV